MTKFILSLTLVFTIFSSAMNLHADSLDSSETKLNEKNSAAKTYFEKLTKKKSAIVMLTAAAFVGLSATAALTVRGIEAYQVRKALKDDGKEYKDYTLKQSLTLLTFENDNNKNTIEVTRDRNKFFPTPVVRSAL